MNADHAFELAVDEALRLLASGVSREECLRRFPQYAADFEPLLAAAEAARVGLLASQPVPTPDLARGKRRFLQAARAPIGRRIGLGNVRWVSAALALLVVIGLGAGVASAKALPGDLLYPVKRSLESVQLALTFDSDAHVRLTDEQAARRRAEAQAVLDLQREAHLEFEGVVESMQTTTLTVSGLAVLTDLAPNFQFGDRVRVSAYTDQGALIAETITLLARPTPWPAPTPRSTPTRPVNTATSTILTRSVTLTLSATRTVTRNFPTQAATQRIESRPTLRSEVTSTAARPADTPTPMRLADTPIIEMTATTPRLTPTPTGRP